MTTTLAPPAPETAASARELAGTPSLAPSERSGQPPPAVAPPGEALTRGLVTAIMVAIALLAFAFSFGNIWALGLRLGVSPWIAPLVGPAVDLFVIGLLLGTRYLAIHGADSRQLRPARWLLLFSGLATLALNAAEPILQGAYGKTAFDTVGPLLLIGWSEVGPRLLRHMHAVRNTVGETGDASAEPDLAPVVRGRSGPEPAPDPLASEVRDGPDKRGDDTDDGPNGHSTNAQPADRTPVPQQAATDESLLVAARVIDDQHRAHHDRPASAETLRKELRIGSTHARRLKTTLRTTKHQQEALHPAA